MTILFAFTLTTSHVEAKKFGGGKSFGKSFFTSPSKKTAPNSTGSKQQPAQKAPAKGSMMKGMLGGILAGGLIAALIGGGAFEGIQIMDIILIALVAFIAIRLFKSMARAKMADAQPAYAGNQTRQNPGEDMFGSSSNANGNDATFAEDKTMGFANEASIPFNLPTDFDINNFLSGARDHYRTIQQAWNENNIKMIEEYVSPALFNQLKEERAALSGDQHTEVMFVDAELVRADQVAGIAELSIKFSGRYRDTVENIEEDITDIWHLERDTTKDNAPWLIVGIEA